MEREKLTEARIQKHLDEHLFNQNSIKYKAENLFVYTWESDFWVMMKSGLCYEYEIKISRNDFFNDFKHKVDKHLILQGKEPYKIYGQNKIYKPNYFYYVVPENLISVDEVPEYAGLIYVKDFGNLIFEKNAPKITDYKASSEELNLVDKFYYNYRSYKARGENDHQLLLEYKNEERKDKQLKELKGELEYYKDRLSESGIDNSISLYIIRRMRQTLADNNVDFDFSKLESEAIELYKKKK